MEKKIPSIIIKKNTGEIWLMKEKGTDAIESPKVK
jgi:hypothetical protein